MIRRIAIAVAVLLVGAVVALGVAIAVLDPNDLKPFITARVADFSGRKLEIGGWELAMGSKPKSVSWATEFVKHCGASVAVAVKKAVGTKTVLAVRALTRSATRVEEEARSEAEELYRPAA